MRQKIATIVAGSYWLSVIGAYLAALLVRDPFGFAFVPFMFLALPWSLFMYGLAEQIPTHGMGATVYALLCFILSGLNAWALYFLIGGRLAHLRAVLFRRSK